MPTQRDIRPRVPSDQMSPGYGSGWKRNQVRGAKNHWVTAGCQTLYTATYNAKSLKSEGRMEELENELLAINWDVIGISETRLQGEKCTILKSGNMLYQNNSENNIFGGVAIMIEKRHIGKVTEMKAISERVIFVTLKLSNRYNIKFIQIYAPTSTHTDEEIELLYEDITSALEQSKTHFTILMGDFNAKIGIKGTSDSDGELIGNFGLGERNARGEMLADYVHHKRLYIMNTFFSKKPQRRWTWRSPDGSVKNEIDYIISDKKHIVKDVSVLNRFSTSTDHRMVRAKIKINIKQERHKLIQKKNTKILSEIIETNQDKYREMLNKKMSTQQYQDNLSINCLTEKLTKDILTSTKKACMGTKHNRPQKISKETQEIIKNRRKLKKDSIEYRESSKAISKRIRKDIRTYNTNKIRELIENNKNMKVLRKELSKGRNRISKIKNSNGTLLTNKEDIKKTIQLFYENLYKSRNTNRDEFNIVQRHRVLNANSEDIPKISTEEIKAALKQMKNKRAPGEDGVTIDMIKMGGDKLLDIVKLLLDKCIEEGKVPDTWNNAEVILLHKKGDITNIENYRPISLLTHLYKLLTKIITNRLTNKLDFYQPPEQAGFRKGYSTIDHLQTIRNLLEKATEYNIPLYLAFIDYEKAFDTIEVWTVLQALDNARVDSRYSDLMKYIYEKATSTIKIDNDTKTKQIKLERGVRQGDTISPKLFTLTLEDIFKKLNWEHLGINIDGKKLNHLRFADDIVLISESEADLQQMISELNSESLVAGLKMNIKKTKIMACEPTNITINNDPVEQITEYIYLGHTITLGKQNQTAEITRRIRQGWIAYGKLAQVFKSDISINLKKEVYDTCVLPVMTYGLETMAFTVKTINRLRVAQRAMERNMLGLRLVDRIMNDEIRRRTKLTDIIKRTAEQKWNWVGHVARQPEERWAKRIAVWRPRTTKRSRGRPQKRWIDDVKEVASKNWTKTAQNREDWRTLRETYVQKWTDTG